MSLSWGNDGSNGLKRPTLTRGWKQETNTSLACKSPTFCWPIHPSIHPDLLYMDECDTKFKSKELSGLNLTDYMWHWQMRHDQGIDTHRDTNTSLWGVINTGPVYLTPKPVPPPTCFNSPSLFITFLFSWICVFPFTPCLFFSHSRMYTQNR